MQVPPVQVSLVQELLATESLAKAPRVKEPRAKASQLEQAVTAAVRAVEGLDPVRAATAVAPVEENLREEPPWTREVQRAQDSLGVSSEQPLGRETCLAGALA